MLTVVVGLDESGNNKNRRPFGNVYSVMPSTVGPLVALTGEAFGAAGRCAGIRFVRTSAAAARANRGSGRNVRSIMDLQGGPWPLCSHSRSDIRRYTAMNAVIAWKVLPGGCEASRRAEVARRRRAGNRGDKRRRAGHLASRFHPHPDHRDPPCVHVEVVNLVDGVVGQVVGLEKHA